jgi:beta-glucanase (GH16 family)
MKCISLVSTAARSYFFGGLLLTLAACGGGLETTTNAHNSPSNSDTGNTTTALSGWTLVWQDEFNTPGLPDSSKWVYDTEYNQRGWWNGELQYYSANRLENARVADGKLFITARQERLTSASDYGNQNYSSARLMTRGKASWTYGRFEIRAKLPCTLGTWPAIWMLGTGGAWPADGEIDIMEQKGFSITDKRQVLGTVHTAANNGGDSLGQTTPLPTACTDFNTYQMTWDADKVVVGVNGVDYFTYNNPRNGNRAQWPFDRNQYLLLNVAVGGVLGGPVANANLPAAMEVDYVRKYRKN